MKTKEEVVRRLRKLRVRYLRKHLSLSQDRLPRNCVYNHEVVVGAAKSHIPYEEAVPGAGQDRPVASSRSTSLVVLQDDEPPMRVCTYGCEDPSTWSGDLCYTAERAASCGWFKPAKPVREAELEFDRLLEDDEYVRDRYPDVATLQWVLEDRVHKHRPGLMERILRWFFRSRTKAPPMLPPPEVEVLGPDPADGTPMRPVDQDVLENPDFDPKLTNLFR